jgi:hypothetical protein
VADSSFETPAAQAPHDDGLRVRSPGSYYTAHRCHRLAQLVPAASASYDAEVFFAKLSGNAAVNKPVVSEQTLGEPVQVAELGSAQAAKAAAAAGPAYVVLAGISFSHFLNDTMQSLIASVYPILKDNYALDFAQIGMITLAFQFTASLL